MKKTKTILFLALTTALVFGGCGKDETNEVIHPGDVGTPITDSPSTQETVPETSVPEQDPDVAPKEGMVQSVLTGLWVDEDAANTRPIAVMFPTDKGSQPQYSIGQAGILYECMEEGNISRQLGVIEGWQDMEKIGNIRSTRDYYGYWSMEWDAFLVHWGGPYYAVDLLSRSEFDYLSACSIGVTEKSAPALGSDAFWRTDPQNPTIHNGYTDGEHLSKAISKLGYDTEYRSKYYHPDHFRFATNAAPNTLENAPGAFDATKIDLSKVFPVTRSSLQYDEETEAYSKFLHGNAQVDAATGEQLTFENVIVQNTYWEYRSDNKYLIFQTVDDSRDGYYFTKGRGIHITWEKESDYAPTKYYDDDGNEITLNPGKTYIAIAQDGRNVVYE